MGTPLMLWILCYNVINYIITKTQRSVANFCYNVKCNNGAIIINNT